MINSRIPRNKVANLEISCFWFAVGEHPRSHAASTGTTPRAALGASFQKPFFHAKRLVSRGWVRRALDFNRLKRLLDHHADDKIPSPLRVDRA